MYATKNRHPKNFSAPKFGILSQKKLTKFGI
jgi:hypothetical protein